MSDINETNEQNQENFSPDFIRPEDITHEEITNMTSEDTPPVNSTTDEVLTKKSNGNKKFKFGLVAVLAVCIVILAVALSSPSIKNAIALSAKSPEKYFQTVLNDEIKDISKKMNESMATYNSTKDKIGYDMNLKFKLGDYTKQLLQSQNISIDEIEAKMTLDYGDNLFKTGAVIGANGSDLLSMIILMDVTQNQFYLKVPELSDAYLRADTNTSAVSDDDMKEFTKKLSSISDVINGDILEGLLVDYSAVVLDNITDVDLSKNEKVNVNEHSVTYNKLTAKISEKDFIQIGIAILQKAKDDKRVEDIFNFFLDISGDTTFSYDDINDNIDKLKERQKTASEEDVCKFSIYVDSKGKLRGTDLVFNDENDNVAVSYVTAQNNKDCSMELTVTEDNNEVISVVGDWVESSTGYTGSMDFVVKTEDYNYDDYTTTSITIDFKDVKYVNQNNGTLDGTFTITSDSSVGTAVTIVLDGESDSQKMDIALNVMGLKIGNLTIDSRKKDFENITMPSSSDKVYDALTESEAYLSTADIYKLLNDIGSKIGIDLTSLIF